MKFNIKRSTYFALATCLSSFAIMTVVVASLFYVYNPKPPKELLK
ncbi:cyclic lactone autoinducer peptide [Paenibacillus terrae]|nr:cyclic lactone autoinducer peptide [Paenibacillus terrae]